MPCAVLKCLLKLVSRVSKPQKPHFFTLRVLRDWAGFEELDGFLLTFLLGGGAFSCS